MGKASFEPVDELGVEASSRPFGRGFQLLSEAHWHPEQEAMHPLAHEARGFCTI
jgi:hypothetical protein